MITVTQHIPSFADTDEARPCAKVGSLEELMAVPFVKRWDDGWRRDGYQNARWYISDGRYLMIDGTSPKSHARIWWVVGILSAPVEWLPEWPRPASEEMRRA